MLVTFNCCKVHYYKPVVSSNLVAMEGVRDDVEDLWMQQASTVEADLEDMYLPEDVLADSFSLDSGTVEERSFIGNEPLMEEAIVEEDDFYLPEEYQDREGWTLQIVADAV